MFVVIVLTPEVMLSGSTGWFPTIIETARVSPIALPTPSITAAVIPDFAAGTTVKNTLLS